MASTEEEDRVLKRELYRSKADGKKSGSKGKKTVRGLLSEINTKEVQKGIFKLTKARSMQQQDLDLVK